MLALSIRWSAILCSVLGIVWTLAMVHACFDFETKGSLLPRDSDYLVGSNVTFRCNLNVHQIMVDDKPVEVNSSNLILESQEGLLPPEHYIFTNETEMQYTIVRGEPSDSLLYYCYLNLTRKILVCPNEIRFGYPPSDVQDFKCRSYGFKNLTCYWKSPPNKVEVNYTLGMMTYYPPNPYVSLCLEKLNSTSCQFRWDTKPFYVRNKNPLYMVLNGTNKLGSHKQIFTISHYSIVVAGPAKELVVTNFDTDSITLSWRPPEGMEWESFGTGVCYRLHFKSHYQDWKVTDVGKNKTRFVLRDLIPNTKYYLTLQGRSCAASPHEDDLWGANVTLQAKTHPDIPWSPPETSDTAFDVVTFNNRRNITLYWKRIPEEKENSQGFQYSIELNQINLDRARRDLSLLQEFKTFQPHYMFVNMDAWATYEFLIRSVNKIGSSRNFTRILVESTDKMPSRPTNVRPISTGGGRYTVSWSGDAEGYTLVWCQRDRPSEARCAEHIEWKELPSASTSADLKLKDLNYDFAVAATSSSDNQISSGLEWAPCTVNVNRVLDQVRGVIVIAESPRTLNVSWKLGCDVFKGIILKYHIYVCPTTCPARTCNVKVEGAMKIEVNDTQLERIQVTQLKPFTHYGVSVAAITQAGHSEESAVQCRMTLAEAPSDPPHDVKVQNVTNTTMNISWRAPNHPNGVITKYEVLYNNYKKDIPVQKSFRKAPVYMNTTLDGLSCFTNYSVRIRAWVDSHPSKESIAQNVLTKIGVPGPMDPPRTEYLNNSHLEVTWKAPEQANGPLNYYLLHLYLQDGDNVTKLNRLSVNGTSVLIPQDCPIDSPYREDKPHLFKVQAVNFLDGEDVLYGPLSDASKNKLCSADGDIMNYGLIIGIIVGSTLTLGLVILALYAVTRWMKKRIDMKNDIKVDLPSGLETPYSNDMNSYEHFKSGLHSRGSDPNLSPKLGYGRMDSYPGPNPDQDDEGFKNRHGSGASHLSAASTDQLLSKQHPVPPGITPSTVSGKGERNPSGDSSSGHDSLSSSLTRGTNLSSDGSTTEDPSRKDIQGRGSRDSGLDEEGKTMKAPDYLPVSSYSKMGLSGPGYLPVLRGRNLSLYGHNFTNSEPSITDLANNPFSPQDSTSVRYTTDPPSPDVPYSKYGLSRSETDLIIQNDMESPDSPPIQQQESYSRFGQRRPSQKSPYVTVGMALLMGPQRDPRELLANKHGLKIKEEPPEVVQDEAYSKLGLGPVQEEAPPPMCNGYVTMQDIKASELHHSLPDLTVSVGDESPAQVALSTEEESSKSGYLPHQMISTLKSPPESGSPVLPDVVNCSNVLPLSTMLQEIPEVKVQGSNGYVTLNQVLSPSTNV